MPELVPTLVVVAVILLAFLGMFLGYRGRRRRQQAFGRPLPVPSGLSPATYERELFYVSTTLRDQPLERVAVAGLGMRSRARLAVHSEGAVLELRGVEPLYIPIASVQTIDRSTMTIDRVVERDGLVRIGWLLEHTPVDTYLRAGTPAETADTVEALHPLLGCGTSAGGDSHY
jgi:hypothetical protein